MKDTIMSGINRLDIKQLRVLKLLLQERNLSKVANIMGLTQQAISEQLKKLRYTFDDPLFIRSSNGVIPTLFAESLEPKIHKILSEIELLLSEEVFNPKNLQGIFRISTSDYALMTVLPKLLKRIHQEAPDLKIILRDFESDNLSQLMVNGEIDMVMTFPEFIPETYPSMLLFQDKHICVAGIDSPYLNQQFTLEALSKLPQLVISLSRANLKGSHDAWFAKKGLKRHIVMSIPSFSAAPDIINATNTIAFLPSRLLPHPKVNPLLISEYPPHFDIIVAWHHRLNNSPVNNWILGLLKEIFVNPH